jgi:hypothetical protein
MNQKSRASKLPVLLAALCGLVAGATGALLLFRQSALLNVVGDIVQDRMDTSFLLPEEVSEKIQQFSEYRFSPLEMPSLSEAVGSEGNPYESIRGDETLGYLRELTKFSLQSKEAGDVLWGRVEGTQYEKGATEYVQEYFDGLGLENVRMESFPLNEKVWRPDKVELRAISGPKGLPEGGYTFKSAMTAFASGTTPPDGITAPIEYVGMGSRAELRGRDLTGKIALLYVRCWEGVLMHSGHLAAARIAKLTDAAAVILWLDLPGNARYAAQLWGMEGPMTDLPWVNIGFQDGLYLRKLIEHSDLEHPPVVNLTVTGTRTSNGTSQNLIAELPGATDETIIVTAHIDGFFHASLDNGYGVAALMTLAKHYSDIPIEQRKRNLLFLVTGHHETTGSSGSEHFVKNHSDALEKTVLILQLEHMVSPMVTKELNLLTTSNSETSRKLFVSNRSPAVMELFKDAALRYGIVMDKAVMAAYAADVEGFYGTGVPAAGWLEAGYFYHSEEETPDMISVRALENMTKANAFIIDGVNTRTRQQLEAGQKDVPPILYDSEDILFMMSMW